LMVHNKCDLPRNNGARPQGVCVSATTGEGLEALQEAILKRLLDPPLAAEEAVPFVSRQVELLREAQILMKSEKIGSARERLLRVLARETYA
jgi:tRNA U34 5-carboxymethylaminomethyl modifying GTPase MnmE/TrmE